jgi:uncharacterized repeat protein (TIGR04138 family)
MTTRHTRIAELVRRDPRFAYEAYEFVFDALQHTQEKLDRLPPPGKTPADEHHVTARELLEGACDYAVGEFGLMARTVFRLWGIQRTDDFGEIVFNLVEADLMHKSDDDTRRDFHDLLDLDVALSRGFRIRLDEGSEP